MASKKSYAYQVKGNKISLIENQFGYGSGQDVISADGSNKQFTLDEIGPTGKPSWVSPISDVTDGIQLEYTYSPDSYLTHMGGWNNGGLDTTNSSIGYSAWISLDGYLTLLRGDYGWSNGSSQGAIAVDEYITIHDSIWSGVHKVKALGYAYSSGSGNWGLQTYTKINETVIREYDVLQFLGSGVTQTIGNSNPAVTGAIDADTQRVFTEGDIVFIGIEGGNSANAGIYKLPAYDEDGVLDMYAATKYKFTNLYDHEHTLSIPSFVIDTTESCFIYKANLDTGAWISADTTILKNENDVIDVPPYLAKALVHYVKAKLAEDQMDIEKKEYFMREFKRAVEKYENSKTSGPRRVMGFGMTR